MIRGVTRAIAVQMMEVECEYDNRVYSAPVVPIYDPEEKHLKQCAKRRNRSIGKMVNGDL